MEKVRCFDVSTLWNQFRAAIRKAIALGAEKITLLGATGTRIDHLLGNIELLGIGLQNHIPIQIVDERNRIRMIGAGITLEKEKQFGKFVSLIPYTCLLYTLTLPTSALV